jgi:DivIVA domain-containing protein
MTPEEVRATTFGHAAEGARGYDEQEVNDFLKQLEQTLSGDEVLTANAVRKAAFAKAPRGANGYDEEEVDAFLDLAEHALRVRQEVSPRPDSEQPKKRWWQRSS